MSLIHFKYLNQIDEGTIYHYSSQLSGLPAANVQNTILSKVWRTESGFVITSYNREFVFRNTSTSSVLQFSVPSGTYTGSGLASVVESNLNSVGNYSDHTCTYNTATLKFSFGRTGTAGVLEMIFTESSYKNNTIAEIMGLEHNTDYSGSMAYTSVSTYGNQHELIVSFTSTQSVDSFIIDNHNWETGTVARIRGSNNTATDFSGPYNTATSIVLSSTLTYNSSIISVEFTSTFIKHFQLAWYDRSQPYTDIGRLFMGLYFEPEHAVSNDFQWRRYKINRRSKDDVSYSGVRWFDRRDSIFEYTIGIDPFDPYFNNTTKNTFENMFDYLDGYLPLWISLDTSLNSLTKYGIIMGDTDYRRLKNTPVVEVGTISFVEQK